MWYKHIKWSWMSPNNHTAHCCSSPQGIHVGIAWEVLSGPQLWHSGTWSHWLSHTHDYQDCDPKDSQEELQKYQVIMDVYTYVVGCLNYTTYTHNWCLDTHTPLKSGRVPPYSVSLVIRSNYSDFSPWSSHQDQRLVKIKRLRSIL